MRVRAQRRRAQVIVYDLDVSEPYIEEKHLLAVNANVVALRRFPYAQYPDYFWITDHAGMYSWKPVIIDQIVNEFGTAVWMDTGDMPRRGDVLDRIVAAMGGDGFFSPTSPGSVWDWSHMGMCVERAVKHRQVLVGTYSYDVQA